MSGTIVETGREQGILQDRVLAYAGAAHPPDLLARYASEADGIVLAGQSGAGVARKLRSYGYWGPLILDPECYLRGPEPDNLFGTHIEDWALRQLQADVSAYLSPSEYIRRGDEAALIAAIVGGRRFAKAVRKAAQAQGREVIEPIFTVLPLDEGWLTNKWFGRLRRRIGRLRVPLALALGCSYDPLASRTAVENLARLATELPTLALLRSDFAAVGALAHGSPMGAIGIRSSVRHIRFSPGGDFKDRSPRLPIPGTLRWEKG
ncbi:MAG: hypothetical protein ACREA0_07295, partial [bacterium]